MRNPWFNLWLKCWVNFRILIALKMDLLHCLRVYIFCNLKLGTSFNTFNTAATESLELPCILKNWGWIKWKLHKFAVLVSYIFKAPEMCTVIQVPVFRITVSCFPTFLWFSIIWTKLLNKALPTKNYSDDVFLNLIHLGILWILQ